MNAPRRCIAISSSARSYARRRQNPINSPATEWTWLRSRLRSWLRSLRTLAQLIRKIFCCGVVIVRNGWMYNILVSATGSDDAMDAEYEVSLEKKLQKDLAHIDHWILIIFESVNKSTVFCIIKKAFEYWNFNFLKKKITFLSKKLNFFYHHEKHSSNYIKVQCLLHKL